MLDEVKSVNSRAKYTRFHFCFKIKDDMGFGVHVLFSFLVLIFSVYAEFSNTHTHTHYVIDQILLLLNAAKIYLLIWMTFILILSLTLCSLDNVSHNIYSFLIDKLDSLKYHYIGTSK